MKRILITGATGTMGHATLEKIAGRDMDSELILLSRDSKKNRKLLAPYLRLPNIKVVWGDLTSTSAINKAIENVDIVLHIGGMVSPAADWHPLETWKVNTLSMRLIVEAVKSRKDADKVSVVYIGSISQYGPRAVPYHWGRTGDPMVVAIDDYYALSKIEAERILSESGLRRWVSLRQTAILSPSLLKKGSDPITFHVALKGALEWTTVEESARLLANLCETELPDRFWRRFYNIGSGARFRMSNYEFECRLMKALSCPPPEKVFRPDWFATRNFHGIWYEDSDCLENWLHFRQDIDPDEYFKAMAGKLPRYFKLAGIIPPAIIKAAMKRIASEKTLGPLHWKKTNNVNKLTAFFYQDEAGRNVRDWKDFDRTPLTEKCIRLSHGYDEDKPESELDLDDMRKAASFRGGKCLSKSMAKGDLHTALEWECGRGHRFRATPCTILLGGHWCSECTPPDWDYDTEAKINPFFAQAWYSTHSCDEHNQYKGLELDNE